MIICDCEYLRLWLHLTVIETPCDCDCDYLWLRLLGSPTCCDDENLRLWLLAIATTCLALSACHTTVVTLLAIFCQVKIHTIQSWLQRQLKPSKGFYNNVIYSYSLRLQRHCSSCIWRFNFGKKKKWQRQLKPSKGFYNNVIYSYSLRLQRHCSSCIWRFGFGKKNDSGSWNLVKDFTITSFIAIAYDYNVIVHLVFGDSVLVKKKMTAAAET